MRIIQTAEHINALLTAGLTNTPVPLKWRTNAHSEPSAENGLHRHGHQDWIRKLTPASATTIGQMLTDTNTLAAAPDELLAYTYTPPTTEYTTIELLCAIDGYETQIVAPHYELNEPYHFCHTLRRHLITQLPGYNTAQTWTITGG